MRIKSSYAEVAAAWIVAIALIVSMAVHAFLPQTPPRLGHGVTPASSARIGTTVNGGAGLDHDLPLAEPYDFAVPQMQDRNVAAPAVQPGNGSDISTEMPRRATRG